MSACHLVGDKWSVHGMGDISLAYSDKDHSATYSLSRDDARRLAVALLARSSEIEALIRLHDTEVCRAEDVVREYAGSMS